MIYVILGQTASGKTSTALKLAKEFNLPIISADAYQCYKMMQIGTDKPTKEEVGNISYHFYDEYNPDEEVSVFLFQQECRKIIENYIRLNKDIIVVGGTFLYTKALLFNYVFTKEDIPSKYENMSLEKMQELLKEKSIETYSSIDINNPRRVKRALDQIDNGLDRSNILSQNSDVPLYPTKFYRIDIDKDEGNRKIDQRVDKMFNQGFLEEFKSLLNRYDPNLKSFLAIGYKETISGLKEGKSIDEIKDIIKVHTHQYAKKQRTFMRNQFKDITSGCKDDIYQAIKNDILLKQK